MSAQDGHQDKMNLQVDSLDVELRSEQPKTILEECRIKRTTDSKTVANITVSLGVARYKGEESIADFVARADAALYTSKAEGRNRVTLAW